MFPFSGMTDVKDKAKEEDGPLCDNVRRWRPSVPMKTFEPRQWQRRLRHVEGFMKDCHEV